METALQEPTTDTGQESGEPALSSAVPSRLNGGGHHEALTLAANAYRREHLLNLTPVQVIKKLYDVAILACKKNDVHLSQRAISQLILGLNFDYEDMAVGLFSLYQYSKECIRKGDFAGATTVLEELREAWVRAFHLS